MRSHLEANRPFPHPFKQRHQLETRVDKIQWFAWNCRSEPRPHFLMFAHWSVMRERSIGVSQKVFRDPGFPLLEARDFQANLGRVGVAGGMLNITIMITGSHEISARDYGIEEPCWGSPFWTTRSNACGFGMSLALSPCEESRLLSSSWSGRGNLGLPPLTQHFPQVRRKC